MPWSHWKRNRPSRIQAECFRPVCQNQNLCDFTFICFCHHKNTHSLTKGNSKIYCRFVRTYRPFSIAIRCDRLGGTSSMTVKRERLNLNWPEGETPIMTWPLPFQRYNSLNYGWFIDLLFFSAYFSVIFRQKKREHVWNQRAEFKSTTILVII